jgi:4-amino-4-deoxy-L-arabinose transferase-like glycosyltransferase
MMIDKKKEWRLFIALICIFILVQLKGLDNFNPGDEHVYIYMGKLISQGKFIYKDFFNSHPPIHILLTGLLYRIFGFNNVIFKLIPLISTIVTSFFLFKLMKEKFSREAAFVALLLFLTSDVLKFSTYSLGVNLSLALLMSGLYYLYNNRLFLCGALMGLACLTGLYSLPVVLTTALVLFLSDKKRILSFSLGFAIFFGLINIIFLLIAGSSYWASVYQYHLMKPPVQGHNLSIFLEMIKANLLLFMLPLCYIILKDEKQLSLITSIIIIYLIFLAALGRIFKFYFLILFPFLAMIGSFSVLKILKLIKNEKISKILLGLLLLVIFFIGFKHVLYLHSSFYQPFGVKDSMVMYIKENSIESDKLFGDITIVPMLALLTGRDISLDMVDTNKMVFESGVIDMTETLSQIKSDPPKFIILRPFTELDTVPEFKRYVEEECSVSKQFKDTYFGDFFLFDCKIKE